MTELRLLQRGGSRSLRQVPKTKHSLVFPAVVVCSSQLPSMRPPLLLLLSLRVARTQSCTYSCAGANGDPHISFAHGGTADFRGSHRGRYAFISSPGFSFAPYFQEIDFWYSTVVGLKQLIHGTFMTQVVWRVRTAAGRELAIKADAMMPGRVDVLLLRRTSASVAPEAALLGAEEISLMPWETKIIDGVHVSTRMLTVSVVTPDWSIEVTSKPIYGLVPPLANETHVHGHWEEEQRRFDIAIRGAFPQLDAHGIVGQSFRDSTRRDGALDEYGINVSPHTANSDGQLAPMTTAAQAEGAIDGVYTDYKLENQLSTDFVYSRFDRVAQPRNAATSSATSRTASTTEWDGVAGSEAVKRGQRENGSREGAGPQHFDEAANAAETRPGRRLSSVCGCDGSSTALAFRHVSQCDSLPDGTYHVMVSATESKQVQIKHHGGRAWALVMLKLEFGIFGDAGLYTQSAVGDPTDSSLSFKLTDAEINYMTDVDHNPDVWGVILVPEYDHGYLTGNLLRTSRPVGGRLPDGFRTLRSGTRPVEGAGVDDFRTWWRIGRQAVQRIEVAISSVFIN